MARQNAPVTFRELFYRLRKLNVPPGKLEELLQEMDIRLVFTAHPTEIVRHTILEQRVEEDRYIQSFNNKDVQKSPDNLDPFAPALARQNAPVTFRELFYRLRKLNVPPGKLEELLQEMDIRLVFTAHPTEIAVSYTHLTLPTSPKV